MDPAPVDFHALPLDKRLEFSLRSPAPFFVTGEDSIELAALNSATGVTLTLAGRFMQLNGQVTSFAHTLTPATNRTLSSVLRALGDGFVMNFSVIATAGTPLIGQCWVRVRIVRGLGGATTVLGTLVSGYVTAVQPIAFPSGKARGTLDGPGAIRSITGTNPAAGAEVSETVPTGARWHLISLVARLVTSATAANRFPILVIDDGTNIVYRTDPPTQQTASVDIGYTAGIGIERLTSTNDVRQWGLPTRMPLTSGFRIRTATAFIEADDNWGAPQLLVEEWLEGA